MMMLKELHPGEYGRLYDQELAAIKDES